MFSDICIKPFLEIRKKTSGLRDDSDKLSSLVTVALILVCSSMMGCGTYLNRNILCYQTEGIKNMDFSLFMNGICVSQNLYNIPNSYPMPGTDEQWKEAENLKITSYPFIFILLGIMSFMYLVPSVIANMIFQKSANFDFNLIINHLMSLKEKMTPELFAKLLRTPLYQRKVNQRSAITKVLHYIQMKESGTIIISSYMMIKFLYLANAIGQMFLISTVFSVSRNHLAFPSELYSEMKLGDYNSDFTMFPRLGHCYASNVTMLGHATNNFYAQCFLPLNVVSDKVFLFLWLWALFVSCITIGSTISWILSLLGTTKYNFIRKCMSTNKKWSCQEDDLTKAFVSEYLTKDAHFILQMIVINSDTVIGGKIVGHLYAHFKSLSIQSDFKESSL